MNKNYTIPLSVRIAKEVIYMHHELECLRKEVEELRCVEKKYNELLDSSINHSFDMSRQVLELCLSGGTFRQDRLKEEI